MLQRMGLLECEKALQNKGIAGNYADIGDGVLRDIAR
jgi:hypothetical protein